MKTPGKQVSDRTRDRKGRLAEELRANLMRRKAQARLRGKDGGKALSAGTQEGEQDGKRNGGPEKD